MQKITTFLWFNDQAEEAVKFYVSLFKDSKIVSITRYGDAMPQMKGKVLTAVFELAGQRFMAIDGGPEFPFTEAISLHVDCQTQAEVDELWGKLTAGGKAGQCGWLNDKYGLSWQIIPQALGRMLSDPDPVKAKRVTEAMLKMNKIDIETLQKTYDQALT
jgi:predicted 3-demethylubiquinone-9 3-methyltransferase (glyoxalase superfamily)